MLRRVLFGVVFATVGAVQLAPPAAAEECVEIAQVKYCTPAA